MQVTKASYFLWRVGSRGSTLWAIYGDPCGFTLTDASSNAPTGVSVDAADSVIAGVTVERNGSPFVIVTFGAAAKLLPYRQVAVLWKVSATGTSLWAVYGGGNSASNTVGKAQVAVTPA